MKHIIRHDTNYEKPELSQGKKKIINIIYLILFLVIITVLGIVIGIPIMKHINEPEKFREWVGNYGPFGWVACMGLMVLQIIIAIIPGGAVEIGAGYAFGTILGSVICMIGSVIGSVIVFMVSRIWGVKIVEALFPLEKIRNLKFLHNKKRRNILAFIVFIIPGTPKDLLSYFMGLTKMELSTWVLISTIARAPAIIVSTMSGAAAGDKNYYVAIGILVILMIGTLVGSMIYRKICNDNNKKHHT